MKSVELLESHTWQPFAYFNITNSYFDIIASTVINTWVVLFFLLIALLVGRYLLIHRPGRPQFIVTMLANQLVGLTTQVLGVFSFTHCAFISALFIFIFFCNAISLIPWFEEPTKDLNTTLALGFISFFYVQFFAIKVQGTKGYIKEYFSPFFIMFPLHIVGKLSSVISISFRLFGNIFGGATIASLYFGALRGSIIFESLGLLSGTNLVITLFFGLFEGFLQAFVFTMLSATYLSIAITPHSAHEGEDMGAM